MKPIIFSTPMVQAILDGKKTQTRRVIKIDDAPENWKISIAGTSIVRTEPYDVKLPRYAAGDILWVRETFCEVPYEYNHIPIKGGHITIPKYAYKADSERDYTGIWKPSIHMPREAARIFLMVKAIRAEKLRDISETDAIAEGVNHQWGINHNGEKTLEKVCTTVFKELWDSLNEKRGYGWNTNPWVWVIEFEREEVEE